MNNELTLLLVYAFGVFLASMLGGVLPLMLKLSHRGLQIAISLVSGVMLGSALFHLLPHAAEHLKSYDSVSNWLLAGLLLMFFLERFFCFHHHDSEGDGATCSHDHGTAGVSAHSHAAQDQAGSGDLGKEHSANGHALHWTGVIVGLSAHSLLNGIALAASVVAEKDSTHQYLPGLAVFLAVACHKPFDTLTLATLMRASGESTRKGFIATALFSLIVPVGVALFYLGASTVADGAGGQAFLGAALAFSAGIFLCIALSDLLPELQFHSHDRVKLSVSLLLGVFFAWAIALLEGH